MVTNVKRITDLEQAALKKPDDKITIDWNDDTFLENGIVISRQEWEKRHKGEMLITWGADDKIRRTRIGGRK